MAVYKKTYRPYEGALTAGFRRFLVIPRYAFEDMQKSRFLTIFFLATFIYPLICALIIYVQHNASALNLLGQNVGQGARQLISINSTFFLNFLGWQSMLALFLASFIGPGQVSPDLANNGLSLYLARPFSRAEYVLGKMWILIVLMSLMTWIPGLLLFLLQAYLEDGWSWIRDNSALATGVFFGSWAWILLLALLALALSAWVKWKPAAGALMFGVFFVAAGFGAAINGVQRTKWGHLLNISSLIGSVWVHLFNADPNVNNGGVFFRMPVDEQIPLWCCWLALAGFGAICLFMLHRKIRGAEVIK
jgi:ABC-2 type transport system permease protein